MPKCSIGNVSNTHQTESATFIFICCFSACWMYAWSAGLVAQGKRSSLSTHNGGLHAIVTGNLLLSTLSSFNGYFPGEPGLAGVYWSKGWWRWWWQLHYWSCKSCKAPVKSSPPTNQHPLLSTMVVFITVKSVRVQDISVSCGWNWTKFSVQ